MIKFALVFASLVVLASGDVSDLGGYSTLRTSSRGRGGYNYNKPMDNYVPKVYKHVHVFNAPEEPAQEQNRVIRIPGGDRHVNVIFVKVAQDSSTGQTEVVLPNQDEQKNLIYVLLQKPNAENNIKVTRPESRPAIRPEVHFIKYESDSEPAPPAGLYGAPAVPPKPCGLYGTPEAEPVSPPPALYGTPEAEPVTAPPKPSGLYGTPEQDAYPIHVPKEPSGFYGLPSE